MSSHNTDLLTNVETKKNLSTTNTRSCKENQTKDDKAMICAINLSVLPTITLKTHRQLQ